MAFRTSLVPKTAPIFRYFLMKLLNTSLNAEKLKKSSDGRTKWDMYQTTKKFIDLQANLIQFRFIEIRSSQPRQNLSAQICFVFGRSADPKNGSNCCSIIKCIVSAVWSIPFFWNQKFIGQTFVSCSHQNNWIDTMSGVPCFLFE